MCDSLVLCILNIHRHEQARLRKLPRISVTLPVGDNSSAEIKRAGFLVKTRLLVRVAC